MLVTGVVLVTQVVLSRVSILVADINVSYPNLAEDEVYGFTFYPRRRSNVRTQRHAQPGLEPGLSDPESSTLTTGLLTPLLNFLNAFIFVLFTLLNPELYNSVARARNCGSTTNIYCRNIDNSGSGVGKPFQPRRSENTCTLKPRKHQPELNTSLINPASEHCLVVARARNCGSTTNIYCRNIDNSGSGVGKPFQLRRSENTSFWTNEDVENEGIKVGCMLEYRVLACYQSPLGRYCKLGKRDGKQFIFHRNDRKPLLVSFH